MEDAHLGRGAGLIAQLRLQLRRQTIEKIACAVPVEVCELSLLARVVFARVSSKL